MLAHAGLEAGERLGHAPPLGLVPGGKGEPQKLSFPGPRSRTLLSIDREPELAGEKPTDPRPPAFARPLPLAVEVRILRLAHEAVAPSLELPLPLLKEEV